MFYIRNYANPGKEKEGWKEAGAFLPHHTSYVGESACLIKGLGSANRVLNRLIKPGF